MKTKDILKWQKEIDDSSEIYWKHRNAIEERQKQMREAPLTIQKLTLENEALKKDVWERDMRIELLVKEIRVLTGPRKKRFYLF